MSQIKKEYGWVILSAMGIGMQCVFTGFFVSMKPRMKYFNKEYMEENFEEIHQKEIGKPLPKLGYPDTGNGFYSQKLPYKAWFEINNAARCHQNFVEQVGIAVPATLVAGYSFPLTAAALGFTYFGARLAYTIGYLTEEGPNKREAGAMIGAGTLMAQMGLATITGIKLILRR